MGPVPRRYRRAARANAPDAARDVFPTRGGSVLVAEDRGATRSIRLDPGPVHAGGVERHRDVAVAVQRDRAAVAAIRRHDLVDHFLRGHRQRVAAISHARADVMGDRIADVELAPARARHAATVVGPRARPDHRRIADAAPALVGHAAGARRRGDMALGIERHRADGAEVLALLDQARTGLLLRLLL